MRNYVQILKNIIEKRIQKEGLKDLLLSIGNRNAGGRNIEGDYTTFGANRHGRENSRDRSRSRGRDDENDPVTMYVIISDL
jgi:hypothetical protein